MKRQSAKELLAASFRELAEKKAIDKITVREIAENCGYSSATFYRQFRDKYDLIAWDYTRDMAALMGRIGKGNYIWKETLLDGARLFQARREYLANLLTHTSGHDSFLRYMTEINYQAFMDYIRKTDPEDESMMEIWARTYILGTVALTCEWVLGRYDMTPEDLADIYEKTLPMPLHAHLLGEGGFGKKTGGRLPAPGI